MHDHRRVVKVKSKRRTEWKTRKKAVRGLITEPAMQQRLAKYLVHECFRNSELENLHADIVPGSKTGDYPTLSSRLFVYLVIVRHYWVPKDRPATQASR